MKNSRIKTFYVLSSLIFCMDSAEAQSEYQVVSIQAPITYSLNSTSTLLGSSKSSLRVELPQNTVAWFYCFSASKSKTVPNTNTLLGQLTKAIGQKGLTATIAAEIIIPKGDAKCNIYLVSESDNKLFLIKKEFRYFDQGSTMNTTEATMDIRTTFENVYYLAFENPGFSPISATVEVSAVIKVTDKKYGSLSGIRKDWQGQNGNDVVNIIERKIDGELIFDKEKLIGTKTAIEDLKECIVNKIIEAQSLEQYLNTLSASRDWDLKTKYKECLPNFLYKRTSDEERATLYGDLGWKAYERGEMDKAIELTEQSLQITPLFYVQANRALFYLVQGQEAQAIEAYMKSLSVLEMDRKPKARKAVNVRGCLKDIESVAYKNLNGSEEAIAILNKALSWCNDSL